MQRTVINLAIATFAAFALTIMSVKLTGLSGGAMVVWPVDGVLLALMLGPRQRRPLLTMIVGKLASIVAALTIGSTPFLATSMSLVTGTCCTCLYLVMKRFEYEQRFTNSKSLMIFLFSAAFASLFTGCSESMIFHFVSGDEWTKLILTGTASNAVGYAVITPLGLIASRGGFGRPRDDRPAWVRMSVIAGYCLGVSLIFMQSRYPLLYPIPLGLMLVAYTADLATVALVVMFTTSVALFLTLLGHGPVELTKGNLAERILSLQVFLIVITATTLPVAVLMAEHERLKRSLITARLDAVAANDAKSAFLATVSHEIRTPLNGVLGMAKAMAMDELGDVQRSRLEVVRNSGETLLGLLNDVLDLSKIEAGKIDLETIDFDLGKLLADTVEPFRTAAAVKGLTLRLVVETPAGLYRGDPTRVRQILTNLISNALKFTARGEIHVTAAILQDGVELTVADTGIGIPDDKLHSLFEKFVQVDASTTRRYGGTGLGLSICRELAHLLGGTIEVTTTQEVGSRFTVWLPLEMISDVPTAERDGCLVDQARPNHDLRILAAEDNATNQLVLRTLLQFASAEVTIVENGQMAVEAWAGGDWDVVLMDVQMPLMDGQDATRAIRARELALGRPRTFVVALTANNMSHQIDDYMTAGMDAYLAKPIEPAALYQVLERAARHRDAREEGGAEIGQARGVTDSRDGRTPKRRRHYWRAN